VAYNGRLLRSRGTMSGDRRSFVQVLKKKLAPVVMVPPRRPRGWGREGFSAVRFGRGDGHESIGDYLG
jgi:hypothetical protein